MYFFKVTNWFLILAVFITFLTKPYNCYSSSIFLTWFLIEQSHLFANWFCYLSWFSIQIPSYLFWFFTFYCNLFSRLFILCSTSANFLSNFGIALYLFTPYKKSLHILVYFCILVKFKSVVFLLNKKKLLFLTNILVLHNLLQCVWIKHFTKRFRTQQKLRNKWTDKIKKYVKMTLSKNHLENKAIL